MNSKRLIAAMIVVTLITSVLSFSAGLALGQQFQLNHSPLKSAAGENDQEKTSAVLGQVLPPQGYKTRIILGDTILKMQEAGVIDKTKFEQLYADRGGMPQELKDLLEKPSYTPLTINAENSQYLINLLWPLGIANKNVVLKTSEAARPENVNNLASTGGWNLGKSANGGDYYNQHQILNLTPEQEALVQKVAANIYRPCCGNSTAFPDCNHGAAMLGMLQLGALLGLNENELYEEALKFNSFWFPDQYSKMALMFQYTKNTEWKDVDPKTALSQDYSSSGGYNQNVLQPLTSVPGLLQQRSGGSGCSA